MPCPPPVYHRFRGTAAREADEEREHDQPGRHYGLRRAHRELEEEREHVAADAGAAAGSVENANTGSAPSARADTPTMTPIDRNTTVTRRRVGRPCTRATPGSK